MYCAIQPGVSDVAQEEQRHRKFICLLVNVGMARGAQGNAQGNAQGSEG
jgi:hypothetical protein